MTTFRLAHLSDPHLPPPRFRNGWRDLVSKRSLSRLAWRRKRHDHRPAILAAIVADLQASAPDHIALTGDLTNFATPEEVAAAAAWLATLAPPRDLTVSPGNHDALTGAPGPERFAAWQAWLGDEAGGFPHVRVRGPVAIVNLCSALPTAPHLAQGELGAGQLARLGPILADLGAQDLYRVVMLHHPVTRGTVSGRKSLVDARPLRDLLKAYGAELVLHGHGHEPATATTAGPRGPIPVLGVPSASSAGQGLHPAARWHGFEIARGAEGFTTRVVARGLLADGTIGELGRYVLV